MTVNESLDKTQKRLLDFFFPRKCPFCGRMTGRELLCSRCKTELPRCDKLRTGSFGECAAPLYYEDNVRKAILDFKFKNRVENLNCFGSLMAEKAAEVYSDRFDAVTWVLCASLCVDWHTEPQETLRKITDNPPQSGLDDPAARRANVLNVYEAVEPAAIRGKRFLLIDDILTTGATLSECVRILREAGAADVVCLTLAMVRDK